MKTYFLFAFLLPVALSVPTAAQELPPIPEELLDDGHVREEFGINEFTTPSIKKIFEILEDLRPLPYEKLKRKIPASPPMNRTDTAIVMGFLIADGFFYAVEEEQLLELEPVGRSLLEHSKVLGVGERVKEHTKPLLDHQNLKDWESLKAELARTQRDVEIEMVQIRDSDFAHLIALSGWLRAFEIGCAACQTPYDPEKAAIIAKPELVFYFIANLEDMVPRLQNQKEMKALLETLKKVQEMITLPEQEVLTEATLKKLSEMVSPHIDSLYGKKQN